MSEAWKDSNASGLALAESGQWTDATRAFEAALALAEADASNDPVTQTANDDVRARLLLNIGQSYFHTGDLESARRFVERSCALRVSLHGEQSLVVARTRGDLAVILAASGHPDEAMSLLERAVSAVERKRGDESKHLVPLLTNAARLLARSNPDLAQPYVARLKALLFAQQQANNAEIYPRSAVPQQSYSANSAAIASEDHLLRAAVAQTVDLLRATPRANMAVPDGETRRTYTTPEPSRSVVESAEDHSMPAHIQDVTLPEIAHEPIAVEMQGVTLPEDIQIDALLPVEQPASASTVADGDDSAFEQIDDSLFDLVEPPPPTLSEIPQPVESTAKANPLGFEVQYGIPTQLHEPLDESNAESLVPTEEPQSLRPSRTGTRAVGGVRRGSTQVVEVKRLWSILSIAGASVATFGAGFGAYFLYNYIRDQLR